MGEGVSTLLAQRVLDRYDPLMSFKSEQGKLQKQGYSKESAGKILGAAAQKAKHPSANQKKVLRHQGKKVK